MRTLVLAIVAACLLATTAIAAIPCDLRRNIIVRLAQKHDEHPAGQGLTSNGDILELFVSTSGTWTLIETYATGISCFKGSGQNWENLPQQSEEDGT